MSLKRNIFFNYLGTGVLVLAPVVALPWYLSALGSKLYGLVSFAAMLQTLMGLLDMGMSQVLVREIAVRFDKTIEGRGSAASLLLGCERVYWLFSLCAGCVTALLAHVIALHWLKLDGLPVATGREAVYGAAAIFATQFPGAIYRSLLVGVQAQGVLNAVTSLAALLRHAGGVIVVMIWPTLTTYLVWHASVALIETLVRRQFAWWVLQVDRGQIRGVMKELRSVGAYAFSMTSAALLGALTVQMDRIVLSKMASIAQFGYYSVAASVALGSLQIIYPLTQAIMPRAIQLRTDPAALRRLNIRLMGLIGLIVILGIVIFITSGKWILQLWLRNADVVAQVYPILTVLLVGTVLNAFYNVGYIYWLVYQKTHRILQVNVAALVISVVLIPSLVSRFGAMGAAIGWLAINLIGFLFSLEWIKRVSNGRTG
jgi:O-antigen/teichoic acid export membrane protein